MLVYIIPFFVNHNDLYNEIEMARECFKSLDIEDDSEFIIYNQGCLSNESLEEFLKSFKIKYHIIGNGENVGIPIARRQCIEYIWNNLNDVDYIAEIHLDMIFTPKWYEPLIYYLKNSDEPMVAPRILYLEIEAMERGFKVTGQDGIVGFFGDLSTRIEILKSYREDKIVEGFVHPVIHKAELLKSINPYDTKFLNGKQGFEDDSIILGYNYLMGLNKKWKPKINFNSCVFHMTMAQRMKLENLNGEMEKNLNGLYAQYGAYGLKELYRIHGNETFLILYNMAMAFPIFKY